MTACIHDHHAFGPARWGADDRIGSGNLLTPERRLAALAGVSTGEAINLDHIIDANAPRIEPNQTPFVMTLSPRANSVIRRRRAAGATNDAGTTLERIEMTTHVGTHIDALGHASRGNTLYNGLTVDETVDDFGLTELGIEHLPPMITRGVMLDVSGPDDSLRPGDVVTVDDLQRAEEAAKVDVQEGDVVCIHTGWGQWFGVDNARYVSGEPGIDVPAAEWLISRGVVAIAADNPAVEVIPNPRADRMLPVHQHTLTDAGVYLIENLNSAALASRGCHAFCFMLLAARFRGATGCPVRPVALL